MTPAKAVQEAIDARESCVRRLVALNEAHSMAKKNSSTIRRDLVEALLALRVLTLDVVEAISRWRSTTSRADCAWPGPAGEENYLLMIKEDTRWLADSPLGDLLNFSPKLDPFFVVPSVRESDAAAKNKMTQTLRRRQQQAEGGGHCPAVLPLQQVLRRRIRAAELVIMQEAVRARLQSHPPPPTVSSSPQPSPPAPPPASSSAAALRPVPAASPSQGALAAGAGALERKGVPCSGAALSSLLTPSPAALSAPSPAAEALRRNASLQAGTFQRALPSEPGGFPFRLVAIGLPADEMEAVFSTYTSRVAEEVVKSMEPWSALEAALKETGPSSVELFWLVRGSALGTDGRADRTDGIDVDALHVDGLVAFRLRRMSTCFGQLLHLSTVDPAWLGEALDTVKARMFAFMPIRSIRATLWYTHQDGTYSLNQSIQAVLKEHRFRWFQLTNSSGVRGQVMNCPRAVELGDPPEPEEWPALEVFAGQLWLLGGDPAALACTLLFDECAQSLLLAGACLRSLTSTQSTKRERGDSTQLPGGTVQSREAKVGRGLSSTELVVEIAQDLEVSGNAVPGVMCEAGKDALELAQRGLVNFHSSAMIGLGVDALPDELAALGAREAVLGRLFVTLDWRSVHICGADQLEVPVHAAGMCELHPEPVFYVETSEDSVFVVIIPWEKKSAPPCRADAFAACTEILRAAQNIEEPPAAVLRLPQLNARSNVRMTELTEGAALGIASDAGPVRLAELSSLGVSAGRPLPGRLRSPKASDAAKRLEIRRPFALCLFHTDIDELNVPLTVTMIV